MNFYVGTSGYSYKEWKIKFYPEKLPAKQMLHFYGEHFQAVEINYTFRQVPKASVLEKWAAAVPANFKFVLKAPQTITHVRQLRDVGDLVSHFVGVAGALKQRLGPLLFQLPPHFKKDVPRLRESLNLLPPNCQVALEFRHQSWFDAEVLGMLRDLRVALCIAEAENDLETPFVSTADWGYLRLRCCFGSLCPGSTCASNHACCAGPLRSSQCRHSVMPPPQSRPRQSPHGKRNRPTPISQGVTSLTGTCVMCAYATRQSKNGT